MNASPLRLSESSRLNLLWPGKRWCSEYQSQAINFLSSLDVCALGSVVGRVVYPVVDMVVVEEEALSAERL